LAKLDPVLDELIREASKKFDVPESLLSSIILEEKIQRYRRGGDKKIVIEKLAKILEEGE
jgi:hypothetical protein